MHVENCFVSSESNFYVEREVKISSLLNYITTHDKLQAFIKPNVYLIRRGEICEVKCKLTSFSFQENAL